MIFDEFLKGLIKHINAEAVIACHGLTSRSQPIQKKIPISICVIHGMWFIFEFVHFYYLVGFGSCFRNVLFISLRCNHYFKSDFTTPIIYHRNKIQLLPQRTQQYKSKTGERHAKPWPSHFPNSTNPNHTSRQIKHARTYLSFCLLSQRSYFK